MTTRAVLLSGGTGFVGGHLVAALQARGDEVWVWTRDVDRARRRFDPRVRLVGSLQEVPAQVRVAAIVNLAGAPVVGPPWTSERRRLLIASRVEPTRQLLEFASARMPRPEVMVSASAIGYYGTRGDEWLAEDGAPTAEFQSRLCQERERAADQARDLGMRSVNLRLGLVLGRDGGIFPRLSLAARWGGAAVLGDGRQWMSWIHIADAVRVIEHALSDPSLDRPVNAVAPEPVTQRGFQQALTRALHRPLIWRVPGALLRLGLGEMSDLLVRGQRVAPRLLQSRGFEFRYPALEAALADLLRPARS